MTTIMTDHKRALRFADLLEGPGIPVSVDRHSIEGGTTRSAEIVLRIRSDAVVVHAAHRNVW
jgi:hypothetical protein